VSPWDIERVWDELAGECGGGREQAHRTTDSQMIADQHRHFFLFLPFRHESFPQSCLRATSEPLASLKHTVFIPREHPSIISVV
jgi:hypothetical protein